MMILNQTLNEAQTNELKKFITQKKFFYDLKPTEDDLAKMKVLLSSGADINVTISDRNLLGYILTWSKKDETLAIKLLMLCCHYNLDYTVGKFSPFLDTYTFLKVFSNSFSIFMKYVLAEAIVRADAACALSLLESNVTITISHIKEVVGPRVCKPSHIHNVNKILADFKNMKLVDPNFADQIVNILKTKIDMNISADEYPTCINDAMRAKEKNVLTLDTLIQQFQFTRQKINAILSLESGKKNELRLQHPELYSIDRVKKFVDTSLTIESMLELEFYDDLARCLAELAVHPEVDTELKNCSIYLLSRYENQTESEKLTLSAMVPMLQSQAELSEKVDKQFLEITNLNAKIDEQHKEIANLQQMLTIQNNTLNDIKSMLIDLKNTPPRKYAKVDEAENKPKLESTMTLFQP